MLAGEYDAVITNFENTNFTAYYKKGISVKLSDNMTVITIYKPGALKKYKNQQDNQYYKDAMVEMSGNSTNFFHYQDLLKLQNAIEKAIDYLNKENENLIDRKKECSYETIGKNPQEKKKTSAIKYADLEIGGIYKDNKEKEWIFLGEADYYKNNEKRNRGGSCTGESRYIYMPNIEGLEKVDDNWFKSKENLVCTIDSYASKKRFFEKVGQLELVPNKSITFMDDYSFYSVYGESVSDKYSNEEKISKILSDRKLDQESYQKELEKIYNDLLFKIMSSTEKMTLTLTFDENEMVNLMLADSNNTEEFHLKKDYTFYQFLFWPILSVLPMKNSENLDSINQVIKEHEDNAELFDYLADSENLTIIIKNKDKDHIFYNIQETMDIYISKHRNNQDSTGKGQM